jgi:hypothetical protein
MICTVNANTTLWNENLLAEFFLRSRGGEYSTKGRPVSNCREDESENMFLYPCTKKNPYPQDIS